MQPVCFLYNPTAGETVITEWLDTIISIYQRRGCTIVPGSGSAPASRNSSPTCSDTVTAMCWSPAATAP